MSIHHREHPVRPGNGDSSAGQFVLCVLETLLAAIEEKISTGGLD
jgi:hypothetical protein